jgi:hypothetical protein
MRHFTVQVNSITRYTGIFKIVSVRFNLFNKVEMGLQYGPAEKFDT